jgi:hypothetical protein
MEMERGTSSCGERRYERAVASGGIRRGKRVHVVVYDRIVQQGVKGEVML